MSTPSPFYEVGRVIRRQVAQVRPTATASIYTPGDGVQTTVKRIIICNQTAGDAAFDLYHDDDGTTYDQSTQLYGAQTVAARMSLVLEDELYVDSGGNIAADVDVASALTITIYGEETQVRAR